MKTLNKTASKILSTLTEGLDEPGDARKLDSAGSRGGTADGYLPDGRECAYGPDLGDAIEALL